MAAFMRTGEEDAQGVEGWFDADGAGSEAGDVGIVGDAGQAASVVSWRSVARVPGWRLAAMGVPMPVRQMRMPQEATASATLAAKSG